MVVGLAAPDGGKVMLGEDEITDLPMYLRAQRGISYLPQEPSVFRKLSSRTTCGRFSRLLDLTHAEQERRIDRLIEDFRLQKVRKSMGYMLGGERRQRRDRPEAAVLSPSFILLDEPFAGIDPIAVLDIQGIIRHLRQMRIGAHPDNRPQRQRDPEDHRPRLHHQQRRHSARRHTSLELSSDPQVRKIYLGEQFEL